MKAILPELEGLAADLTEIQSLDAHEVIRHKLDQAHQYYQGEFIVEDVSLYIDSLCGLPGPFIKWFLETVGPAGVVKMARALGGTKARVKIVIGYSRGRGDVHFFEGVSEGDVVEPRGGDGFGWDPIFIPAGYTETYAEMGPEEKNKISMRKIAAMKLKDFLGQSDSR